jgi:hypothetical protein
MSVWEFHPSGAQQNFRYLNNVAPGDGALSSPSSVSGASVNVSSAAVTIGEGMINIAGTPGSMLEGVLVMLPA